MAKRLLELKDSIKGLASDDVKLTDYEWGELQRLVSILSIPQKATIALQKENLTPGECLLEWREVVFRLEKFGGDLALKMAQCIKTREKKLLENKIFEVGSRSLN